MRRHSRGSGTHTRFRLLADTTQGGALRAAPWLLSATLSAFPGGVILPGPSKARDSLAVAGARCAQWLSHAPKTVEYTPDGGVDWWPERMRQRFGLTMKGR